MNTTQKAKLDARNLMLALVEDLAADMNFEKRFRAAPRELHEFFWALKREPGSQAFVADLLFDTNGNYPYSEQLDEILQEFQLSGVLSRPNPTYRFNDISIAGDQCSRALRQSLTTEQAASYDRILRDFKQRLGVPASR